MLIINLQVSVVDSHTYSELSKIAAQRESKSDYYQMPEHEARAQLEDILNGRDPWSLQQKRRNSEQFVRNLQNIRLPSHMKEEPSRPNPDYVLGRSLTPQSTVSEVLRSNVDSLAKWYTSPYGRQFRIHPTPKWIPTPLVNRLAPVRKVNGSRLPGAAGSSNRSWMCLQGGMCLPGDPFNQGNDKYTTTTDLNRSIKSGSAAAINPNFNLYVLSDELARDINYDLPGAIHVAEYPDGSGHALFDAGNEHVYEFGIPGLDLRPLSTSSKRTNAIFPWMRKSQWNTYQETHPNTIRNKGIVDARTMMLMPNTLTPEDVAGQFYDLAVSRGNFKDNNILNRDGYVKRFLDANRGRKDASHYMMPSILRNVQPLSAPVPGSFLNAEMANRQQQQQQLGQRMVDSQPVTFSTEPVPNPFYRITPRGGNR